MYIFRYIYTCIYGTSNIFFTLANEFHLRWTALRLLFIPPKRRLWCCQGLEWLQTAWRQPRHRRSVYFNERSHSAAFWSRLMWVCLHGLASCAAREIRLKKQVLIDCKGFPSPQDSMCTMGAILGRVHSSERNMNSKRCLLWHPLFWH